MITPAKKGDFMKGKERLKKEFYKFWEGYGIRDFFERRQQAEENFLSLYTFQSFHRECQFPREGMRFWGKVLKRWVEKSGLPVEQAIFFIARTCAFRPQTETGQEYIYSSEEADALINGQCPQQLSCCNYWPVGPGLTWMFRDSVIIKTGYVCRDYSNCKCIKKATSRFSFPRT